MTSILDLAGGLSWESFLILSALCFLAAFVDSIAGGGGLISLPAFMAIGLPPHVALGTNKLSACIGTVSSTLNFLRSGKIIIPIVTYYVPLAFFGAFWGVKTALMIPAKYFQPISFALLISVFLYTLCNKKMGEEFRYQGLEKKSLWIGALLTLSISFYDGFLGPGTGSFLIFMLIKVFGLDFSHATATTKIINLCSNLISTVLYWYAGKMNIPLGLMMACIMVLGAFAGSHLAIHKGSSFIKPVFLMVTSCLILKMGYSFILTVF